jgi:hypothetical protein
MAAVQDIKNTVGKHPRPGKLAELVGNVGAIANFSQECGRCVLVAHGGNASIAAQVVAQIADS